MHARVTKVHAISQTPDSLGIDPAAIRHLCTQRRPLRLETFEMLKLLSGALPQAGRAACTQLVSREMHAVSQSNAMHNRQYAPQPAPSPAGSVSNGSPFSFPKLANTEQRNSLTTCPCRAQPRC